MDVFAVLEDQVRYTRSVYLDQLSKYGHISALAKELAKIESKYRDAERAKAAIAELIAAAQEVAQYNLTNYGGPRLRSALAALEQMP